jgi:hypothetical protein
VNRASAVQFVVRGSITLAITVPTTNSSGQRTRYRQDMFEQAVVTDKHPDAGPS